PSRSGRDAEDRRDLGRLEACIVMKGEDRSLVRRQALEASLDLVTVGQGEQAIGGRRFYVGERAHLSHPPTRPRGVVEAFTDNDAMEPGIETGRVAEGPKI